MLILLQVIVVLAGVMPFVIGLYAWKYLRDNSDDGGDDPPPPPEPPAPEPVSPPLVRHIRDRGPVPRARHRPIYRSDVRVRR